MMSTVWRTPGPHTVFDAGGGSNLRFAHRDERPPRWNNHCPFVSPEHTRTHYAFLVPILFNHLLIFCHLYGCAVEDRETNLIRHPALADEAENTFKEGGMRDKCAPGLYDERIAREFERYQRPPSGIDLESTRCDGGRPRKPLG